MFFGAHQNQLMENMMHGFFGGATNAQGRFEQDYSCFPVSFLGREDLERGNKIILPPSALDTLARLNVSYPMLFMLSNDRENRRTHCGVLEFVAEEGTCYIPYWMMNNLLLTEGDMLKVTNTSLPKGTFVKLQPCTKDFLDVYNPKAVLENALRNFATLTKGDTVALQYNNKTYEIEIVEAQPENAISIIEADVNVDFAPPKDYVEPEPEPKTPAQSLEPESNLPERGSSEPSAFSAGGAKCLFTGAGQRIDGKGLKEHQKKYQPVIHDPAAARLDPWGPRPWEQRVRGGVRREAPYGYSVMIKEKKMVAMPVPGQTTGNGVKLGTSGQ